MFDKEAPSLVEKCWGRSKEPVKLAARSGAGVKVTVKKTRFPILRTQFPAKFGDGCAVPRAAKATLTKEEKASHL